VAHLDNIMYVVCDASSTIRRYNTDTHQLLNVINIKGMGRPLDIIICRDDRQLYISDWNYIWRVAVDNRSCVNWVKWLTIEMVIWNSLSLMSRRLLVASCLPPALCQYNTTNRQLQCVVALPQYMTFLWHGVETTRGTFVISHRGTLNTFQSAVSELFSFVNYQHITVFSSTSR